jgi:hypothetical protein
LGRGGSHKPTVQQDHQTAASGKFVLKMENFPKIGNNSNRLIHQKTDYQHINKLAQNWISSKATTGVFA